MNRSPLLVFPTSVFFAAETSTVELIAKLVPFLCLKIPADCNQTSLPTSVLDSESTRHRRAKGLARTLDFRFKEANRFRFKVHSQVYATFFSDSV